MVQSTGDSRLSVRKVDGLFASTGDYWTLGLAENNFSIRNSKGLDYIYRLLQHPGEEFSALDLERSPGFDSMPEIMSSREDLQNLSVSLDGGDSGEMLDRQARQQHRRRLDELNDQLELAQELRNSDRAAEVQSEIDFLAGELSRAVDRWNRDRRAGSRAERARLNVTRAVKSAIEKVAQRDAELGEVLRKAIRTGLFCSYVTDSSRLIEWRFSPAIASSAPMIASAPILPRSESAFAQALVGRTTFVGRETETTMLEQVLEQTWKAHGKVVMVSGPPGVGKTRMTAEFCSRASRSGVIAFPGGCSDRKDPAPFLPFLEIFEAALASAENPRAFRDALGDEASEISRLMPQLQRIFDDIPPPLEVPAEQSRRILFASIGKVIVRAALSQPVVLVLEDLQWADGDTLSLIDYLAKSIATMRLMIIGTFREGESNRMK